MPLLRRSSECEDFPQKIHYVEVLIDPMYSKGFHSMTKVNWPHTKKPGWFNVFTQVEEWERPGSLKMLSEFLEMCNSCGAPAISFHSHSMFVPFLFDKSQNSKAGNSIEIRQPIGFSHSFTMFHWCFVFLSSTTNHFAVPPVSAPTAPRFAHGPQELAQPPDLRRSFPQDEVSVLCERDSFWWKMGPSHSIHFYTTSNQGLWKSGDSKFMQIIFKNEWWWIKTNQDDETIWNIWEKMVLSYVKIADANCRSLKSSIPARSFLLVKTGGTYLWLQYRFCAFITAWIWCKQLHMTRNWPEIFRKRPCDHQCSWCGGSRKNIFRWQKTSSCEDFSL